MRFIYLGADRGSEPLNLCSTEEIVEEVKTTGSSNQPVHDNQPVQSGEPVEYSDQSLM